MRANITVLFWMLAVSGAAAADYDQGNLNHVGGGLAAVAGAGRWRAMGSAGIRPRGDDHFNSSFEP